MDRPGVTPDDLRSALTDLVIAASGFVRGTSQCKARLNLRAAVLRANEVCKAADVAAGEAARPVTLDELFVVAGRADAEALVTAYIANGGDWQALVAAVNRNCLKGAMAARPPASAATGERQ